MQQTAYKGITNLYKDVPYDGGICKFWYIPISEVADIPAINPANQYTFDEPILLNAGSVWRGPVPVANTTLGYTETQEVYSGLPWYKQKVTATAPGNVPQQQVNIDNMAYGKYLIVAKLRAGGFYILIGSKQSPADFDSELTVDGKEATKHKLAFSVESLHKAVVLPSFAGDASGYIYPCDGPPPGGNNETEVILFTAATQQVINWNTTRIAKFGIFPEVECYIQDDTGAYYKSTVQPYIDTPPPSFTTLTFDFAGASTGFIIIK